jgi:DNA-binding SARP family transcriptional activator
MRSDAGAGTPGKRGLARRRVMPDDRRIVPPPAPPTFSLRLLGDPVLVEADGGARVLERRAAGLLALVALEPGVTRARAAALLWPDSENPRQALRQQIARFKRSYGAELVRGDDTLSIADGVAVDLAASGGGALLGDLDYSDCEDFTAWLEQQRARRRSGAANGLGSRIAAAEAEGDLEGATRLAEELLHADSDSEAHHRTLMRLHYLRGDLTQALVAYERLAWQLKARFGARPSAETEALARALRAASVPAASAVPAARELPVTMLRPPRMVGRRTETAALVQAWARGQAALLLGEPGLGKSRLLAEFGAGRRVVTLQGRPGDAGVPYATLARMLRAVMQQTPVDLPPPRRTELARLLPELAPALPLPADGQRLVLQGAIEALLTQAQVDGAPVDGLIVDDLHFADEASVEMLQALIGAEPMRGLRWALAQRPGEGSDGVRKLRSALEEGQALVAIDVAPLDVGQMAELVDSLGLPGVDATQVAEPLVRHTGGNPLFALETLKQGLASGVLQTGRLPHPAAVGALIERRLKQLSERALALARVAAVAGTDFSIALAEEITGARALELADAWSELERAQVLRDQSFAHDLVYDAVLRSVPEAIARHVHGAVAHFLESRGGEAARIASHWLAAGSEPQALPALHRAAAKARAGLRRREELDFLMTAARIEEATGRLDEAWQTLEGASQAQMCVDAAALPALESARDRLARTPQQRARLADQRSTFLNNLGRFAEAEVEARTAVAAARCCDSPQELAEALSSLSTALAMMGRADEALAASDEMLALLDRIESPAVKLFSERGVLLDNLGRTREALALHRQAVERVLRGGEGSEAVDVLSNLACSQMDAGRMGAALASIEQAFGLAGAHDEAAGLVTQLMSIRVNALRELGQHGRALRAADEARRVLAARAADLLPLVGLAEAAVWWQLGQVARVQQTLPDVSALGGLPRWLEARRWILLARCRRALRQPVGDALERAQDCAADGGVRVMRDIVGLHAAGAGGQLSDLDALQAIAAEARRDGRDGVVLAAASYGARLAATLGMRKLAILQADEVRAALDLDASAADAVVPADIGQPEVWLCLADAYRACGRVAQAEEARARGLLRIETIEREHVPPEFRESFRLRNPVHLALRIGAPDAPAIR